MSQWSHRPSRSRPHTDTRTCTTTCDTHRSEWCKKKPYATREYAYLLSLAVFTIHIFIVVTCVPYSLSASCVPVGFTFLHPFYFRVVGFVCAVRVWQSAYVCSIKRKTNRITQKETMSYTHGDWSRSFFHWTPNDIHSILTFAHSPSYLAQRFMCRGSRWRVRVHILMRWCCLPIQRLVQTNTLVMANPRCRGNERSSCYRRHLIRFNLIAESKIENAYTTYHVMRFVGMLEVDTAHTQTHTDICLWLYANISHQSRCKYQIHFSFFFATAAVAVAVVVVELLWKPEWRQQ